MGSRMGPRDGWCNADCVKREGEGRGGREAEKYPRRRTDLSDYPGLWREREKEKKTARVNKNGSAHECSDLVF